MNTEYFIAKRILRSNDESNSLSKPMVRISISAIALGLAVMILSAAIVTGFKTEIRNKLLGFGSPIQVTNYDSNVSDEPQPIYKNQLPLADIMGIKNIKKINCFATKNGIIKTKEDNEGVVLKGVSTDYNWEFIQKNLLQGEIISLSDTAISKSIVISQILAKRLKLGLGDKMVIYFLIKKNIENEPEYEQRAKAFTISGIYKTGYDEKDSKIALIDLAQIQKLNYWESNQVAGYEIALFEFEKLEETNDRINELIGQGLIAQTIFELNPTVFSWLDLQNINAIIVIALMVLVAGINMITSLLIIILERTNMIGLLKALGAQSNSIQKIFIYNSFYLLAKGVLWGNFIGLSIALIQKKFELIKLDQQSYYISSIPIQLHFNDLILLNIGTIICCLLMMILPSFLATKISPIKAIKFN